MLATKLYFPMSTTDQGLSRTQIIKQLNASLSLLKTDYIDLYQCHRYDFRAPLAETMQALTDVVRQGKVRYIGFSEWPVDKIRAQAAHHDCASGPALFLTHYGPSLRSRLRAIRICGGVQFAQRGSPLRQAGPIRGIARMHAGCAPIESVKELDNARAYPQTGEGFDGPS